MESSGLLDAWVNPEGTILSGEMRFDTFLLDDGQKAGFPGRPTLADVLRPSADRPGGAARVPAEVIERIVRGIGLGENRSEEHTSELQSQFHLVCRLLLEKKKKSIYLYRAVI